MKKFAAFAMLLSLTLVTIGCKPADKAGAPADAAPADAAPADAPAETPAE